MRRRRNKRLDPGQRRHPLIVQQRATPTARNRAGEAAAEYIDLSPIIWGAIEPAGGRELYAGEQRQAEVSHKITIGYWPGLTTNYRLKHETTGQIFDINAVIDLDMMSVDHELLCKEKTT